MRQLTISEHTMTVEDCEILLNALDYTAGVLRRDGEAAAKLRAGLVVARNDAIVKGPPLCCQRCRGTNDVEHRGDCFRDHLRHCGKCRRSNDPV